MSLLNEFCKKYQIIEWHQWYAPDGSDIYVYPHKSYKGIEEINSSLDGMGFVITEKDGRLYFFDYDGGFEEEDCHDEDAIENMGMEPEVSNDVNEFAEQVAHSLQMSEQVNHFWLTEDDSRMAPCGFRTLEVIDWDWEFRGE
jgi:hypothetical protein